MTEKIVETSHVPLGLSSVLLLLRLGLRIGLRIGIGLRIELRLRIGIG
jgi:hypothetical protein